MTWNMINDLHLVFVFSSDSFTADSLNSSRFQLSHGNNSSKNFSHKMQPQLRKIHAQNNHFPLNAS